MPDNFLSVSSAEEVAQFARAGDSDCYDVIGFRSVVAARPIRGALPLRTLEEIRDNWQLRNSDFSLREHLLGLRKQVTHLSIDLPPQSSNLRAQYEYSPGQLSLKWPAADGRYSRRTYLSAYPPQIWCEHAVDDDAPLLRMQSQRSKVDGIRWLPLATLIERGHFPRMQESSHLLTDTPQSGCFMVSFHIAGLHPIARTQTGFRRR